MEKKILLIIALSVFSFSSAQIKTSAAVDAVNAGENAFLDASSFTPSTGGWTESESKGLIFPQVNLTQFRFNTALFDGTTDNYPTAFDGMIVYNVGTGNTADPALSTQSEVEPGFYYFHNPNGKTLVASGTTGNATVAQGKWVPLGSGGSATIKTTETRLGKVGTDQLFGIKGTFSVAATTGSTVSLTFPAGLTSIYSIKIYDNATKKLVASSLSSYDVANNKAVTGMGNMSIPLPPATYDYVLEYFK